MDGGPRFVACSAACKANACPSRGPQSLYADPAATVAINLLLNATGIAPKK